MNSDFNQWKEQYYPIENYFIENKEKDLISNYIFQKRGKEFMKVNSFPPTNVWLVYASGRSLWINTLKNRAQGCMLIGYIITMNPYNNYEEQVDLTEII